MSVLKLSLIMVEGSVCICIHCYEVNFMQYRAVFIRIKILFRWDSGIRHFSNNMSWFFSIQRVWKTYNNRAFNNRYLMIAFFNNSYLKKNMISDLSWWYFILYCTGYIVQAKNSFYVAEYQARIDKIIMNQMDADATL